MARQVYEPAGAFLSIKRLIQVIVIVVVVFFVGDACLTRIDASHVGIKVRLAGSSRGVQDIPVVSGWVFFNPLTEQIISFPTSVQNVIWTKTPNEGPPIDESITFSSEEGVNVNADVGLAFHIDPSKAPHLYLRFRQNDMILLANGYVRNAVREAFNDQASRMKVQDIYGSGKVQLVSEVVRKMAGVLGKDGFLIDQVTFNGALRLPENVAAAINRAMEATQQAIQAENRVRQVRAEADQAVAEAHGAAEAARQRAEGEADAVLIRARADARANEIIRLSATGTVLQYRAIERWNGRLPMMQGGDKTPLLTFDVTHFAGSDAEREKKLAQLLGEDDAIGSKDKPAEKPTDKPADKPAEPAKP